MGNPAEVAGLEAGKPKLTPHADIPKTYSIQTGRLDSRWQSFGIVQAEALLDGRPTGYKLVIKNGKPISFLSNRYVVIPNELAVEAGDLVAQQLGAKPFHEFKGPWAIPVRSHVLYYGYENSRMKAFYTFDEPVDVDEKGDNVYIGFMVSNAIDGGGCLGFGVFTFRFACQNMFWMKPWALSEFHARMGREVMSWARQIHLGKTARDLAEGLDNMVEATKKVVEIGLQVQRRLKAMTVEKANAEKLDKLVKALPLKYAAALPWAGVVKTDKKTRVVGFKPVEGLTTWQAFNDVTYLIWHDRKQSVDTKEGYMLLVQRAMF